MNPKLTTQSVLVAACLFGGMNAQAFSLGPVSGPTVIGQPLQVSAPIQFDDVVQQAGNGCVGAELLSGDRLVPAGKVRGQMLPASAWRDFLVRVFSSEPVDEPFVTLLLRAGCGEGQQLTRRYVLLADVAAGEPVVSRAASSLRVMGGPASLSSKEPVRAERRARGVTSVKAVDSGSSGPPIRPRFRTERTEPEMVVRSGSRLQLALWDPNAGSPWLRASTVLGATPVADASPRAAAIALWQALNARPEDLLRTADRLRGLEGEASSLRSLTLNHRSKIASARESLIDARNQGYAALALTALLALLTGAAAAYLLHRRRRSEPLAAGDSWYGDLELRAEPALEPASAARGAAISDIAREATPPTAAVAPKAVVAPRTKLPPLPMPAQDAADVPLDVPLEFTLSDATRSVAPVQVPSAPAGLKVEALHGAQQQSEFFVSLGQFDEAVVLLSEYLRDSSERPVLAFLELFRIHHALGDRASYEALESEFRKNFGLDFASFGEYRDEHLDLDDFPWVVGRISISWPSAQSLEVIEDFLFRKPGVQRDVLSLDAYRDLVWLYGLGQALVDRTGKPAGLALQGDSGLPNNHFILPWAVGGEQEGPLELSLDRLSSIDVAGDLHGFAVDIDLTALPDTQPAVIAASIPDEAESAFDSVMEMEARKLFR
jgi:hypothetical protein